MKKYECVCGHIVAPEGTYKIGELIVGIGEVQYITEPDNASAMGRKGGKVKSDRKTAACRENGKRGGRPFKGYRLHWEGSTDKPTAFRTMKEVRAEIRRGAKEGEITIAQAEKIAYVITEKEYQESLEQ